MPGFLRWRLSLLWRRRPWFGSVLSVIALLAGGVALKAQGPVPRLAPEINIVEASGRTTMLSSYRGQVVLLAFISTECPHCQRASALFEQLSHEFSGRLKVAEVAFNEGADAGVFTRRFGLSFPVGARRSRPASWPVSKTASMPIGTFASS